MDRTTAFDLHHPGVAALFFLAALVLSMATFQPVVTGLSFIASLAYHLFLKGWRATMKLFLGLLAVVVVIALVNPLVNAAGSTMLFVWGGHHAYYLEALLYGMSLGFVLAAVLVWFSNLNHVLTSDKVMQLTGSTLPTLGLMITMIMRLIPQFLRRNTTIRTAQSACTSAHSCAGEYEDAGRGKAAANASNAAYTAGVTAVCTVGETTTRETAVGETTSYETTVCETTACAPEQNTTTREIPQKKPSRIKRIFEDTRAYGRVTSVLMGWSMEDSLDTAIAMRARGWGASPRRSSYRRSNFRLADGIVTAVLALLIAASIVCLVVVARDFAFYPHLSTIFFTWWYVPYVLFLLFPFALELKGFLSWH